MGAEKGNQYWIKRLRSGNIKKYETAEDLLNACCDYFTHTNQNPWLSNKTKNVSKHTGEEVTSEETYHILPYTIVSMCTHMGICRKTWENYRNQEDTEDSKDILRVIAMVEDIIRDQKYRGASTGQFNANIISRDLGLVDKQSVEHDVSEDFVDRLQRARERAGE